jgi:hypothetical protein
MGHRVGVPSADPIPILRRLGGCGRRAVLLDEGVTERGLARAAAAGHVRRIGRGVYAAPGADAAILAAVRCGGLLTCDSGAGALGLAVFGPARRIHVATRNNPVGIASPVVLHRSHARRYDGPVRSTSMASAGSTCSSRAFWSWSSMGSSTTRTGRITATIGGAGTR